MVRVESHAIVVESIHNTERMCSPSEASEGRCRQSGSANTQLTISSIRTRTDSTRTQDWTSVQKYSTRGTNAKVIRSFNIRVPVGLAASRSPFAIYNSPISMAQSLQLDAGAGCYI